MSETTSFPFDSTPGAHAVAEEDGNRRRLLLLVAAGVLVVAVLGYFLAVSVLGGGNDQLSPGGAPHLPGGALAATAPAAPKVVPKTFAGVIGRDPFGALVTAPVTSSGGTSGTSATSATSATKPAPPAAGTTPATTPGMTTFKVLSVTGSKATVSVDTKKYTMTVGQVFAKSYKLLKTTGGSCAAFAFGEMRFSLCEGQTFIF